MTGAWPSYSLSGSLAIWCLKVPSANSKCPEVEKKNFSWEKLRVIDSEFDALSRNNTRFAWEFLHPLPKKIIVFWYHFLSALKTGPLGSYVTFFYVPPFLDYCTPPARTLANSVEVI